MKESQTIMMQHSEVKIMLLRKYLESYLLILSHSKHCGDIYLFDLFCGEGIYNGEGKGSPIVILETIKNLYFSKKQAGTSTEKFHCLFNDIEESKVEKLRNEIINLKLHYPEIGDLQFTTQDYRDLLPNVIKKINSLANQKAFVFIDPYGYRNIKVAHIKELLKSNKSEVLLFLPTQFMFRFEKRGTPECLVDFINELLPGKEWPESETGIEFIDKLTEAFRMAVGEDYFVDSFIISRDRNQFFCLFFFTSHIYGFDRMLETKWKIDEEEGRGWHYNQESDLFNHITKQPNTVRFERKLIEFLRKERSNGEIYQFQLENGHRSSHTNDVLLKLQKEGNLIAVNENGSEARRSAFYISYQNFRDKPNKIRVKIK